MFSVKAQALHMDAYRLSDSSGTLRYLGGQIEDVAMVLAGLSGFGMVVETLYGLKGRTMGDADGASSLSDAANEIANRYRSSEDTIVANMNTE